MDEKGVLYKAGPWVVLIIGTDSDCVSRKGGENGFSCGNSLIGELCRLEN